MKSSVPSAASSRPAFGVLSTGLPAIVSSARTWPWPGVSISSASARDGQLAERPRAAPRTRLACRGRPRAAAAPGAPVVFAAPAAGVANIAPPGRSRLPVSALRTSTSQLAARAEALRRRADPAVDRGAVGGGELAREPPDRRRRRCRSAPATSSGGDSRARARAPRRGRRRGGAASPRSTRSSANEHVRPSPAAGSASVPGPDGDVLVGLLRRCRVRRGSTTTSRPPRARIARRRPRTSGAVIRRPLEAIGLAPEHEQVVACGRGRAAATRAAGAEHRCATASCLGCWSTGARREEVLRAQRLEQQPPVEQRGEVVRRRVADVDGDRVAAVLGHERRQPAVDLRERLVPGRLAAHARPAPLDQRRAQPVGVLVQLLQRRRPSGRGTRG